MIWRISAIAVTLALLGGCNTMHGMGQDVDSVFGTNLSGDKTATSASPGSSTSASAANGSTTAGETGSASASSGSNGSAAH